MDTTIDLERQKVDECDQQIIENLKKRFESVRTIGELKKQSGIPALDNKRWQEILENRKSQAQKSGLSPSMITEIWNVIHKYALEEEGRSK